MTHDGTLNVINSDSKKPEGSFSVYSIPYDGNSVLSDSVAKFVLDALRAPALNDISKMSVHELIKSRHFYAEQKLHAPDVKVIYVASTRADFTPVSTRFVNYMHQRGFSSAMLINHEDESTWSKNPNIVILIGGESGIGKTLEMLTNFWNDTDLIVYIKFGGDLLAETNEKRDTAFKSFAAERVCKAIKATCRGLNDKLTAYKEATPFRVRICFDEMGDKPCATRACCAVGPKGIREALGWPENHVEVRVFAAGTGIGTAKNTGGSENHCFQLSILRAPRGSDLYWTLRKQVLKDTDKKLLKCRRAADHSETSDWFDRLKAAVTTVCDRWRSKQFQKRADAIRERNNALRKCFELAESNKDLMTEALFSAVESDTACVAALENPRVAALIVAQCQKVASAAVAGHVARGMSGFNVRHEVLQPVAEDFKTLNGLSVEPALREHVDSLWSHSGTSFSMRMRAVSLNTQQQFLMASRGVLVSNTTFVPVKEAEDRCYVQVRDTDGKLIGWNDPDNPGSLSHIACYHKEHGQYSISPAMVVLLLYLMASMFDDRFSDMGDMFERATAKTLFMAAQVFHGRSVKDLVDFIVGPFAIIGANALETLNLEQVIRFESLTLRLSGALNGDHVVNLLKRPHRLLLIITTPTATIRSNHPRKMAPTKIRHHLLRQLRQARSLERIKTGCRSNEWTNRSKNPHKKAPMTIRHHLLRRFRQLQLRSVQRFANHGRICHYFVKLVGSRSMLRLTHRPERERTT
ncbi:Hypothetical protein, putative [Bodo saltans]|uniref:Uncharacterized protein n=1 Tax=Bodo saltans TaxID=75058 RepID=A0A0S4IIJ7_BODSA|nr:Hypothetical protein, putative [Bodo saltans]|eukprot:CUE72131.1 Hypothetical protein, putative [Bodo saltans]